MNDFQYLSIKQIVDSKRYPFTIGQMRHYLIMRHRNGLQNAVRKVGKMIVLRIDLFDQWIEEQGEGKNG